ncbi:DUF1642 domain-containing protein [Streptococcus azizii]|uniref:Phage protein n=1 Tax=Streptococcus azizii TaxID=1579424 RepID=A0AB36JP38_9STRE|nr:DUF1642 domain-containing protein [Streptococcus azizii]ONK25721.1 hypothetical protein BVE86_09435 [Streptococcus azizii]
MNTQELINKIEQLPSNLIDKKVVIAKDSVVELVKQLDERPKVEIPRFMSDWIEENRRNFKRALLELVKECYEFVFDEYTDIHLWFLDKEIDSFTILVNAHQFGYEVEQEQLYVVAIPDEERGDVIQLWKNAEGKLCLNIESEVRYGRAYKLTEQEIKNRDERLWHFAKLVEVE